MMKHIKTIGFVLFAAAALITSCADPKEPGRYGFGPDKESITVGPEGSTEAVKLHASQTWLASTDQAWILVSPANGDASRECKIRIDSTYQDVMREGEVKFTSAGETRTIKISQMGFSKQIVVEGAENGTYKIEVPDYAPYGTTFFDVKVTTNVDFNVVIEDKTIVPDDAEVGSDANWLKCDEYKVDLVQSKPRTIRLRFKWDYNTKWWNQDAAIRFVPKNGEELAQQDGVNVTQAKAPKITDDRAGDSIAILAIARQINLYGGFDSSKNMLDWGENIQLYDQSAPKELQGRVKYIEFYMFDTNVGIPFEIRYLNKTEEIVFYSNTNNSTRDIDLGTSICELGKYGHLKRLTIEAYGISKLPAGFEALGSSLEELTLGSNNFSRVPDIINPQNFPHLKKLSMGANRRTNIYDLSNSSIENPGLGGTFPRRLLEWETLEELNFSYNYFEGSIPSMEDYPILWTEADGYRSLVGKPKVLPNAKVLRLNLNRLSGKLPDWLLNHPNIKEWDPDILIFVQEGKDTQGRKAGFDNIPDKITPPVKE